jgi:putative acyl-CoA dehydrogenase
VPILRTHDRYGNRIDAVELDPSWHALLRGAVERDIHSLPWRNEPGTGAHVVRAGLFMLYGNANAGVMCPVSMTYAAVPALRDGAPELAAEWEPRLTSNDYEAGALAGMAMTERQGGSDVRANITRAEPVGDGVYELHGHKWFCSYPPCDVFLVLAQAPAGLSCFLVERGPGMEFQRLKDKLGTRSLPSSEVEFRSAQGRLVGEEGRGVPAIIRMVNHTRLDCLLGGATGMRRGTVEAIHHARHRAAFGALLVDQPAMQNVLADLAIESEAATAAALRVARAYDSPDDGAFRRFATAVMKYWVCKRAAPHAAEALECLGGNGFVEESGLPLLYRDAPLNSIWEGSGNVAALDVLRAMVKEPEGLPAFLEECALAAGADARLDAHLERVRAKLVGVFAGGDPQFEARRVVEDLAVALQGSLLVRYAPPAVADAFCAARLDGAGGRVYGTLPAGVDAAAIVDRALPV